MTRVIEIPKDRQVFDILSNCIVVGGIVVFDDGGAERGLNNGVSSGLALNWRLYEPSLNSTSATGDDVNVATLTG